MKKTKPVAKRTRKPVKKTSVRKTVSKAKSKQPVKQHRFDFDVIGKRLAELAQKNNLSSRDKIFEKAFEDYLTHGFFCLKVDKDGNTEYISPEKAEQILANEKLKKSTDDSDERLEALKDFVKGEFKKGFDGELKKEPHQDKQVADAPLKQLKDKEKTEIENIKGALLYEIDNCMVSMNAMYDMQNKLTSIFESKETNTEGDALLKIVEESTRMADELRSHSNEWTVKQHFAHLRHIASNGYTLMHVVRDLVNRLV